MCGAVDIQRRLEVESPDVCAELALGGAGPNWEQFRSVQFRSQLAARSVELDAGPNWDQLVQLAYGRPCV